MTDEPIVSPPDDPPPEPPTPPQPAYPGSSPGDTPTGFPVQSSPSPANRQPGPGFQPGPGWQQQPGMAPTSPAWGPPQGSARGPGWSGQQPPRKGGKTWKWVLLGIGAVLLLVAIVGAVGCYACVRGVQKAADEIREGSYTISHNGETRWVWKGGAQPRDTAPPDAAKDAETLAGAKRIKAAIEAYRRSTGSYPYTGASAVASAAPGDRSLQTMLTPVVDPWPTNPWTDRPMTDDPHRGDFLYVLWDDGTYTLRVFLSTGEQDL